MDREYLKMRILLQLYEQKEGGVTVTALSKMLEIGKTYVSKLVHELSEENLLNINDPRHPILTADGENKASKYSESVKINLYRLRKDGISAQNAIHDAYLMAFYCKDSINHEIKERYRLHVAKKQLKGMQNFTGADLCALLSDGEYRIPFIIYKSKDKNNSENVLSMANKGFEQPCTLRVENGNGKFTFLSKPVTGFSPILNKDIQGKIASMQYQDECKYFACERINNMYMIPASAIRFTILNTDGKTIMHGFTRLKISCDAGVINMPQSTAMCTFLL